MTWMTVQTSSSQGADPRESGVANRETADWQAVVELQETDTEDKRRTVFGGKPQWAKIFQRQSCRQGGGGSRWLKFSKTKISSLDATCSVKKERMSFTKKWKLQQCPKSKLHMRLHQHRIKPKAREYPFLFHNCECVSDWIKSLFTMRLQISHCHCPCRHLVWLVVEKRMVEMWPKGWGTSFCFAQWQLKIFTLWNLISLTAVWVKLCSWWSKFYSPENTMYEALMIRQGAACCATAGRDSFRIWEMPFFLPNP